MILTDTAYSAFKHHVLSEYPREACGLVVGDIYHPCKNAHEKPEGAFRIAGSERVSIELRYGSVQAVLHSHTYDIAKSSSFLRDKYNPAWPSVPDQRGFMDEGIPWGIVATDGSGISEIIWLVESAPLYRRQFAWFTSDCYSVVRDWYHQNTTIRLPNFTREWEFWKNGLNTVQEGLATIPHRKLPAEKAQAKDMALFALGSPVINHVAVLTGDNDILHMFANQGYYAHTARWDQWKHKARYVARFEER